MELLYVLLVFGCGFWLGRIHAYYRIAKLMRDVAEDQGIDLQAELDAIKHQEETNTPLVHKLQVEKHGELLYLFDAESNDFICQGSDVHELAEIAKKYKNVLYAAVKHDDKIFQFKDGESTEIV